MKPEMQVEFWKDKHDDEYLRFERIPEGERLHVSRELSGLLKLASLMEDPSRWEIVSSEHDEFWPDGPELERVTEADFIYLLRCGVRWDSSLDQWAMFA